MTDPLSFLLYCVCFCSSQAEKPNPTDQADTRDPTAHAEEEGKPPLYDHDVTVDHLLGFFIIGLTEVL